MEQPIAEQQRASSPAGRPPAARRFSLAVLALSATVLLTLVARVEFLVDDAFISLRFARNWVELGAPVFNSFELSSGGQPVEGFSNLLWTALLALLYWAGAPFPEFLGPLQLSLAMGVLIVQLRFVTTELRLGRAGEFASVALLATSAPFVAWTSGGMETTLFTLLLTSYLVGLLRGELRRQAYVLSTHACSWAIVHGTHHCVLHACHNRPASRMLLDRSRSPAPSAARGAPRLFLKKKNPFSF